MTKLTIVLALIVMLVVAVLLLTARGDPAAIDRAKAEQIQQQAEAEARARAAAEARKQADWESTRSAVSLAKNVFLGVVGSMLALVLAVALLVIVTRLWQMSRSVADAFAIYTEERARLAAGTIKMDRETRTFPALVAGGALHNLETAEVYPLAEPKPADPQQVAVSGQVRALGITAQAAERVGKASKDAHAAHALPAIVPLQAGRRVEEDALIIFQDQDEIVDL